MFGELKTVRSSEIVVGVEARGKGCVVVTIQDGDGNKEDLCIINRPTYYQGIEVTIVHPEIKVIHTVKKETFNQEKEA